MRIDIRDDDSQNCNIQNQQRKTKLFPSLYSQRQTNRHVEQRLLRASLIKKIIIWVNYINQGGKPSKIYPNDPIFLAFLFIRVFCSDGASSTVGCGGPGLCQDPFMTSAHVHHRDTACQKHTPPAHLTLTSTNTLPLLQPWLSHHGRDFSQYQKKVLLKWLYIYSLSRRDIKGSDECWKNMTRQMNESPDETAWVRRVRDGTISNTNTWETI